VTNKKVKVKKRNREYWAERFAYLEDVQYRKSKSHKYKVEQQYIKAMRDIEKQISNWYMRFAVNNEKGYDEAKLLLNTKELKELQWDVKEYIKYGKENKVNQKWIKELENASAKAHITRLDALKLQIQNQIEVLFSEQYYSANSLMKDAYTSNYYHTAYEMAKGLGVATQIAALDVNKVSKVLSKPWTADGLDFSRRIWGKYRGELLYFLEKDFTNSIIQGKDPKKLISELASKFDVPKRNAANLIMTESAFFSSVSRRECFADLGVGKYEIIATLDTKTSEKCKGMDTKVFPLSEYKVWVTAPPFHNFCRTTTAPWIEDLMTMRAARGKDGKVYYVPGNISYNEWYKKYVK
jgi:SPP1 gp7 family putative phage head morphogenesis protein